jgi:hypothetical protein
MKRILLFLAFVLLQGQTDVNMPPPRPVERPHVMEEAEVDSLTPTTGAALLVSVAALEGVPVAAPAREAFLRGFRGAFREAELRTDRVAKRTGLVRAGEPLRNRFRMAEPDDAGTAWTARVRLEWSAGTPDTSGGTATAAGSLARAWPGLAARVTIEAQKPETPRSESRPVPETTSLRLPSGHPVDAPYWQHAGRQVAFLLLERLHRLDGDLDDSQRVRLEDARRGAPGGAR